MLGFIIAEKEETGSLIKSINAKTMEFNGIRFYIGAVDNKQAIVCFCGCGKVNAAAATMNMVVNFNIDKIFNIGLCGTSRPNIKPGTILIGDKIENCDVDMTYLDYPLNQIPAEPMFYSTQDKNILTLKQIIKDATIGTIVTGDSFVTINNVESFPSIANKDVLGFDMEAAAVAQVCNRTKTDFICVKIVSDNLTFDEESKKQYRSSFKELGKKIEKICINAIKQF